MDRHQFVESLLAKKAEAEDALQKAQADRDAAYRRSRTYVASLLQSTQSTQEIPIVGSYSYVEHAIAYDPAERVSDEAIITLCGNICELRKQRERVKEEAEAYRREDVVKRLADILLTGK